MSKLAFNKLNITKELPIKTINFNGIDIEVKQYLDLNSKQNIIDMAIEPSKLLPYVNRLLSDAIFSYLAVLSYTNLELTLKKEKEDPIKVYDIMESSGLIDAVFSAIPEVELNSLVESYKDAIEDYNSYKVSIKGSLDSALESLPQNLQAINSALETFDPEKFKILNELTAVVGIK